MERIERILLITFLGAWALFPDMIPGPIDDVVAVIAMIHQIGQLAAPDKEVID